MIPKRSLDKFLRLWKKSFGEEIPETEILKRAERLITLYRATYGDPLVNIGQQEKDYDERSA